MAAARLYAHEQCFYRIISVDTRRMAEALTEQLGEFPIHSLYALAPISLSLGNHSAVPARS